ncbi:MAG TPA: alpha/beta fold hydrolase [Longimicrobium sp.]|nr:alpha/beta fold hydrolase [Longimicrobium sp.]
MPPRECVVRLERWLAAEGAALERVRYARPAAGGEVEAWRLVPRVPVARVVATHGAGNDALYPQIALFKALVREGVEVFSFDVDGHGAASTTVFDPAIVPGAIAAAVGEAERGRPDLPLHLLGHSFGGSLVLHALADGSVPHARSGIAISAPITVDLTARVAAAELLGFLRLSTLGQREHYGVWGTVPAVGPLKRRAYPIRGAAQAGAPFAYVAAIRALLARLRLERTASDVRVPVLLAYGAADRLVPLSQGRRLAERIPRAELVEVPGATHWSTAFAGMTIDRAAAWTGAHAAVAA